MEQAEHAHVVKKYSLTEPPTLILPSKQSLYLPLKKHLLNHTEIFSSSTLLGYQREDASKLGRGEYVKITGFKESGCITAPVDKGWIMN